MSEVVSFEDYKKWVLSRVNVERALIVAKPGHEGAVELCLAGLGLAGENGEVVDLIKKVLFHGKPVTPELREKLRLEMGDKLWYFALLCELMGETLEGIIQANIQKLIGRDGANGENFHIARAV